MRVASDRRLLVAALAVAGLCQSLVFPGAARADFLEDLFGQLFRPPNYRGYGAYPEPAPRWGSRPEIRRNAIRGGHRGIARTKVTVAARTDTPTRPQGPADLMEDESLRKGDAVMTPAGVRVFVGYSSDHYGPEDFKRPSEIKGLSRTERKALAVLDTQSSVSTGTRGILTGRSATGRKLTEGEVITDPKGRTVRYVGP